LQSTYPPWVCLRLDSVPEVDESAVKDLVQFDHARKPCMTGMSATWQGCVHARRKGY
jgi:hypothetical protein